MTADPLDDGAPKGSALPACHMRIAAAVDLIGPLAHRRDLTDVEARLISAARQNLVAVLHAVEARTKRSAA